jgi:hypothetical protein
MNTKKQFLALLGFQTAINPFIAMMPLLIGFLFYVPFLHSSESSGFHPTLGDVVQCRHMWFVGFFAALVTAPEAAVIGGPTVDLQTGLEFLLTRAADRRLVLRARSALFYLLVLALPLASYLIALASPVLQVAESDPVAHAEVLDRMPESMPARELNTISIPNGNTLVQSWRLWLFTSAAIGGQLFVYSVYQFKYRRYIFWGAMAVVFSVPLVAIFADIHDPVGFPPRATLFFAFVSHQGLCWLGAIAALIFGQLWCERRFSRTEQ